MSNYQYSKHKSGPRNYHQHPYDNRNHKHRDRSRSRSTPKHHRSQNYSHQNQGYDQKYNNVHSDGYNNGYDYDYNSQNYSQNYPQNYSQSNLYPRHYQSSKPHKSSRSRIYDNTSHKSSEDARLRIPTQSAPDSQSSRVSSPISTKDIKPQNVKFEWNEGVAYTLGRYVADFQNGDGILYTLFFAKHEKSWARTRLLPLLSPFNPKEIFNYRDLPKNAYYGILLQSPPTQELSKVPEKLRVHYIRGLFDSSGYLSSVQKSRSKSQHGPHAVLYISQDWAPVLKTFLENYFVLSKVTDKGLEWVNCEVVSFLSLLYDEADPRYMSHKKKNHYQSWVGQGSGSATLFPRHYIPYVRFARIDKDKFNHEPVAPTKKRASDLGYDISIVGVKKVLSKKTTQYATNIAVDPAFGWAVDILPRSSIINSGYMMSNSIGIIDPPYRGNLLITLTKVDDELKDINLENGPVRIGQLILRQSLHFKMIEVEPEELGETNRGVGGFGSTNEMKHDTHSYSSIVGKGLKDNNYEDGEYNNDEYNDHEEDVDVETDNMGD